MPITGLDQLEALAGALRSLAGGSFEAEVQSKGVEIAAQETQKTISSGRTPYGSPWPAGGRGLTRLSVAVSGKSITVRHPFAGVHQAGAVITGQMRFRGPFGWRRVSRVVIPRRQLVPDSGMPTKWRPAIKRAVVEVIRARLKV